MQKQAGQSNSTFTGELSLRVNAGLARLAHLSTLETNPIGKMMRFLLRLTPKRVFILQGRLRGKRWISASGIHGFWLGNCEYKRRIFYENTVREGSVVFDLGAHAGYYTMLASVLVGKDGKVFAFEPYPGNIQHLKEHLRLNHVTNATVIEAAVSDQFDTVLFQEGTDGTLGKIAPTGNLKVKTVRLDDLVERGEIPTPDYIKMDIEGAEMQALTGATAILVNAHPILLLSTHGPDIHEQCLQLLASFGYHISPVDEVDGEITIMAR